MLHGCRGKAEEAGVRTQTSLMGQDVPLCHRAIREEEQSTNAQKSKGYL